MEMTGAPMESEAIKLHPSSFTSRKLRYDFRDTAAV